MLKMVYLDVPLAPVLGVILVIVLLDGYIGQVYERVIHISHICVIFHVTESSKAMNILICF